MILEVAPVSTDGFKVAKHCLNRLVGLCVKPDDLAENFIMLWKVERLIKIIYSWAVEFEMRIDLLPQVIVGGTQLLMQGHILVKNVALKLGAVNDIETLCLRFRK